MPAPGAPGYRRVLWAALVINGVMFVVEGGAGLAAGSVALQADALDFLGDTATYALTLFVLGLALRWRARAALLKGASMGLTTGISATTRSIFESSRAMKSAGRLYCICAPIRALTASPSRWVARSLWWRRAISSKCCAPQIRD